MTSFFSTPLSRPLPRQVKKKPNLLVEHAEVAVQFREPESAAFDQLLKEETR